MCAETRDLNAANRVVAALRAQGLAMDYKMYVTWMTAAARVGDADGAHRMSAELRAETGDPGLGREAATALIAACAEAMVLPDRPDRRRTLVLLRRAMAAFEAATAQGRAPPDAQLCNAALLACGRAWDLPGAMRLLDLMTARGLSPDGYTYSALVTAHASAGQGLRALALFDDAMAATGARGDRLRASIPVYSSALNACRCADVSDPLARVDAILATMSDHGVAPDDQCACTAVAVLGMLGDAARAQAVFEDLVVRASGRPRGRSVAESALVQVRSVGCVVLQGGTAPGPGADS